MQAVEPVLLLGLILLVAVAFSLAGALVAARILRRERRARGFFVLGFSCGVLTSAVLRRHGLRALKAALSRVGATGVLGYRAVAFAKDSVSSGISSFFHLASGYSRTGRSLPQGIRRARPQFGYGCRPMGKRHEIRDLHIRH